MLRAERLADHERVQCERHHAPYIDADTTQLGIEVTFFGMTKNSRVASSSTCAAHACC
jgi:hypothetical protein